MRQPPPTFLLVNTTSDQFTHICFFCLTVICSLCSTVKKLVESTETQTQLSASPRDGHELCLITPQAFHRARLPCCAPGGLNLSKVPHVPLHQKKRSKQQKESFPSEATTRFPNTSYRRGVGTHANTPPGVLPLSLLASLFLQRFVESKAVTSQTHIQTQEHESTSSCVYCFVLQDTVSNTHRRKLKGYSTTQVSRADGFNVLFPQN